MSAFIEFLKQLAVPISKLFEWLSGRKKEHTDVILKLEDTLNKANDTIANLYSEVLDLRKQNAKIYEELLSVKRDSTRREHELASKIDALQNKVDSYEKIIQRYNETNA